MAKETHDLHSIGYNVLDFILRNVFGLLCLLSGITYQVYQMTNKSQNLSRAQIILSIILWAVSGCAIVYALSELQMNKLIYGFICWATPIVIKPFADKVAEHAPNMSEKLVGWLEYFIERKKKDSEK